MIRSRFTSSPQDPIYPLRFAYGTLVRRANYLYDLAGFSLSEALPQSLSRQPSLSHTSPSARRLFRSYPTNRIFILASGEASRWRGVKPKQLALVHNRPLIERLLRQTNHRGIIISHHPRLRAYPHAYASHCRWTSETLLSTQAHWGDSTTILLGDVYFSDHDLNTVLSTPTPFTVFGSRSQGEIFALKFDRSQHQLIAKHLRHAIHHARHGGRGKLWEFYRSFLGVPLHRHVVGRHFVELAHTTDFDTVEEHRTFLKSSDFVDAAIYLKQPSPLPRRAFDSLINLSKLRFLWLRQPLGIGA